MPSLLGWLLTQLLQELRELALGGLLECIERLLLAFRSLDVARVAIRHHQTVVRWLATRLEFYGALQKSDGVGVSFVFQARFSHGQERFNEVGPQRERVF